MSGIGPIPGGIASIQPPSTGGSAAAGGAKGGDFGSTLKAVIENSDKDQQASMSAIEDLLAGRTQDVVSVVSATAKADLSFKLLLGVRNKVIDAYRQTLNMQI